MKPARRAQDGFGTVIIVCLIGVLAGLSAAGWAVYQYQTKARLADQKYTPSGEVLMIVGHRGGLCASSDNSVEACNRRDNLYANGAFENHTALKSSEIVKLRSIITETDFLKYKKKAYPYCESYVDGTDTVLIFPQKYPRKAFTLCELDIPAKDPTIKYMNDLIQAHQKH